ARRSPLQRRARAARILLVARHTRTLPPQAPKRPEVLRDEPPAPPSKKIRAPMPLDNGRLEPRLLPLARRRSAPPLRRTRTRVLGEFGFRVAHFEDYAFAQQVALAARARHFVSNHGAGLTNMLFMRPGGSVLELRRRGERERNWFFNLANAVGLDYYYQTCAPA